MAKFNRSTLALLSYRLSINRSSDLTAEETSTLLSVLSGSNEGGDDDFGVQAPASSDGTEDAAYSLALLLKLRLAAEDANGEQRYADSSAPYLLVLASIIFLLSLVANVLVVVSVFRSRRYRATAGLLALNLTVADLLITVVLLPLWMVQQNLSTSNSYLFSIMVCKIHPAFLTMSVGASAYTLVALSVDRMCIVRLNAVRAPAAAPSAFFSSHQDASSMARRRRRSSLASFLCCCDSRFAKLGTVAAPWLLSILVAAPVLYFRTAQEPPKMEEFAQVQNWTSIHKLLKQLHEGVSPESSCREEWPVPFQLAYDQSLLVIHFALPAIVQLCLYIYLGWIVSRLTAIPATRNNQSNESCTALTLVQQQTVTQLQPSGVQQQQQQQQATATPLPSPAQPNNKPNSPPLMASHNNANNGTGSCNQNSQPVRPAYGSVSVVRRQRAWRTLIALSVLFPISWLPYYILYTYLVNADPAAIGPRTTQLHTLLELFAMLGFSNSAQNAIVYCATDDRLRGSVKSLLSMIPCVYRWHTRQNQLTIFNGGNGYNGHNNNNNNGDFGYAGAQPVVLQMNQLTPSQPRPISKPIQQAGGQYGQQRRGQQQQPFYQFNGSNNNNNNRGGAVNNYQPSPKLLAPPAVPLATPDDRRLNNNSPSHFAQIQQQRLRGGTSDNRARQRKQAGLMANNNNNNNIDGEEEAAFVNNQTDQKTVETALLMGQRSDGVFTTKSTTTNNNNNNNIRQEDFLDSKE